MKGPTIRCAIYTRKSTEEGLDQAFNSLDAQREACVAYIMSQRHEGWTLVPDYYDDGGYSGGNMGRPGLKQLLADVKAGKIDVIVVYKVDRLTRALSDFARIVDILDGAGASFVSITQAFNTTTSMGRLTLNVLLSFAQFEREVTGERVRDKIAASKRKGMWMGGPVPLGYDLKDRKLIINHAEAEVVRHIYARYLELASVTSLAIELERRGWRTKQTVSANGRHYGGKPFGRGHLYKMLSSRLYRGEVTHKQAIYPGEHEAIISSELWDKVQDLLRTNAVDRRHQVNAKNPSLLAGMIMDADGRRMTPSHAAKGGTRYRYYVSVNEDGAANTKGHRIAAGEIETAVIEVIKSILSDPTSLIEREGLRAAHDDQRLIRSAQDLSLSLANAAPSEIRAILEKLVLRIVIDRDQVDASYDHSQLAQVLIGKPIQDDGTADRRCLEISTLQRRGHGLRLTVKANSVDEAKRDGRLIAMIIKAQLARRKMFESDAPSDKLDYSLKHVARMARLAFLAPDIIASILQGEQPASLTSRKLLKLAEVPLSWADQRRMLGFS